MVKRTLIASILVFAVCVAAIVLVYNRLDFTAKADTKDYKLPDAETNVLEGEPQFEDPERYAYSEVTVAEGYVIKLCGLAANDGQTVKFNFTNPSTNTIRYRSEIYNQNNELIGSMGIIEPGQYCPSITLNSPLTDRETPVTVKIIAYDEEDGTSRGNVNLNLTLYLRYES